MKNLLNYTTPVSGVVIIRDVARDFVVVVKNGIPAVVDPAYHEPIMGYDPLLPHYTQHALNAVRKIADKDAYADHRFSLLIAAAAALSGKRGMKFLRKMNLFEIATHMTQWSPEHWSPERRQQLVLDLAAAQR